MSERRLRIGVIGLSRGFTLMIPTFVLDPRIALVAAADPRPEARGRFISEFGGSAYAVAADLCADPAVEVVYVASPHQLHAQHVALAASAGKHVLVEKPMAISLDECRAMIDQTGRAGVVLVAGHSHSFDRPIQRARELLADGAFGAVRMITALNYTDFLYRPRRSEELDTAQGGGVVFSQGAHQVDIVRLIGGGRVRSVRAATGRWDPARPTEGAFSALLTFEGGAFASVTYSGYGHFDTDEFLGWIGELGEPKPPEGYGGARETLRQLGSATAEIGAKRARAYGAHGAADSSATRNLPRHHEHFGSLLISCDRADLRPLPDGVMIYGDAERRLEPLPAPAVPRAQVIDELYDAVIHGRRPLHSGEWALATLEVCLAILQSAAEDREISLAHQIPVG